MLPSAREFFGYDIEGIGEDDEGARLLAAVRAFQNDHQLSVTGILDDATQAALVAAHGI